ncbi:MAG: trypsin-like peptidase domain-containing protein [Phycisphaerales bacterium]
MKTTRLFAIAAVLSLTPSLTLAEVIAQPDPIQRQAMDMAFNISDAFEYAAEKIEPSVVHITVQSTSRYHRGGEGLGSGVIIDPKGYILTNNHVASMGNDITVRLFDGRELDATLVGTFEETDLAVIKIQADDLVAAEFGDSEAMRVGQWVLAIGSPFGFDQTVTAGIVSAKGRGSFEPNAGDNPTTKLQEFIQTDAAINPGNSGGPLVDLHGHVIGINTAIISRTGSNNGLGFAIPADIAQAVSQQIIEKGDVQRGWLGISMDALDPRTAHDLGIDGGVLVQSVLEDGPAEHAGLEAGDIITTIGGRSTENIVRLSNAIMLAKPDTLVEVDYIREGEHDTTSAIVTSRDEAIVLSNGGTIIDGIGIGVIPNQLTRYRGRRKIGQLPGFVVVDIDHNSSAYRNGIEPGDFIYKVDGENFDSAEDLQEYIEHADKGEPIRFEFIRNSKPMYADVLPE